MITSIRPIMLVISRVRNEGKNNDDGWHVNRGPSPPSASEFSSLPPLLSRTRNDMHRRSASLDEVTHIDAFIW
jgi:hypothetical protein